VVPEEARRLYQAGLEAASSGDLHEAFELIENAVQVHPDYAEACKTLARLSMDTNEIRAFQNWCHEAARIDPRDPEPYWMLGELLAGQRRREEAVEALERALALCDSGDGIRPRVQDLLERIRR